jgi:rhamnosyltransferase
MTPVTVLLRTRNAGRPFGDLLDRLRRQRLAPLEIVVVDSGSADATLSLARQAGARSVSIDPARFTHAGSTNLGFREARGEIVAMLSQDALPADETWLERLTAPLDDPSVAGVFGRQIPRPDCYPLERWEIERCYPESPPAGVAYSNVNSATRRADWERRPFDESVRIAEDRFWALQMLAAGRRIEYVPEAAVIHSHAYTIRQAYRRCRDEARARRAMEGVREGPGLLFKAWPRQALRDARRLAAEGRAAAWPGAALYRLAQFAGLLAGGGGGPAAARPAVPNGVGEGGGGPAPH